MRSGSLTALPAPLTWQEGVILSRSPARLGSTNRCPGSPTQGPGATSGTPCIKDGLGGRVAYCLRTASPPTHRVLTGWIGRRGDYIERGSVNALIPLGDQSPYDRGWTPPSFVSRVRGSPAAAARCGASPTPRTGQTREICRRTLGLASRQWPGGNATSSSAPSTRSPSRPPRQADDFVHEEIAIGHDRSDPSTRRSCGLELLRVTADLQRELGTFLDTRVPARRGESSFLFRLQSDGARAARWIYERVYARR